MTRILVVAAAAFVCHAAIIDRIAVVVGSHAILDSDISRDIRLTAFLNGEALDFSNSSVRKPPAG